MKTCLIYGQNGLDLEIAFNLRSFYKALGFKTFFSEKLYDADLLVVVRAVDKTIDTQTLNFSLVHVYDYGGWDYDAFVRTIDQKITYIFCTSSIKKNRLIEILHFPANQVFVALPPIDIKLWCKKIKELKYNTVHIGNFKPITEDDSIKDRFNQTLSYFKTHIWGLGWQLDKYQSHGKTSYFTVSSIYSQSKFALGLMYPFQREVTFSSRFWLAPLNGCLLFSEPGLFTSKIPGVIETDYSQEDIEEKFNIKYDRYILQNEAKKFWLQQNEETLFLVKQTLLHFISNDFSFRKLLNFIFVSSINLFREFYQKLSLFKLFKNN